MDSEEDLFRLPPPCPYEPVDLQLSVPDRALAATIALLRRAGHRESGLLWYGPRDAVGNGTVAYVVAPRQLMTWGNYTIPADALAEVVHRLPDDWKPLAQVHSHPGRRVEHSSYDDRMMSSRRALSLVFPVYGCSDEPFPVDIGIHEWQNDYWHLLDLVSAEGRVVIVDGTVQVEDMR
jgi:hypothetical protein